jgi:HEAT repeat protein
MPAIQAPAVVKEVMSALLKTIKDPDAKVRTSSVRALGALGEKSDQTKAVTSVVMKMAEDPDSEVRASALTALCQLCKEPEKLLPMLLKSLKDKDPFVRVTAAGCLVGTTHAKEAQPVLLELVKNPGQGERRGVIRFSAMMALDRMGYDLPEKLRRDVAQEMQQEQADQAR